jgi:hypothetical protein
MWTLAALLRSEERAGFQKLVRELAAPAEGLQSGCRSVARFAASFAAGVVASGQQAPVVEVGIENDAIALETAAAEAWKMIPAAAQAIVNGANVATLPVTAVVQEFRTVVAVELVTG